MRRHHLIVTGGVALLVALTGCRTGSAITLGFVDSVWDLRRGLHGEDAPLEAMPVAHQSGLGREPEHALSAGRDSEHASRALSLARTKMTKALTLRDVDAGHKSPRVHDLRSSRQLRNLPPYGTSNCHGESLLSDLVPSTGFLEGLIAWRS
jgi:hypothetical protein